MKIVLDANVFLVSIPKQSQYRCIFDGLIHKQYTLLISNDILTEYEEIIGMKTTHSIAKHIVDMLLSLSNVKKTEIFFRWNLIEADPDDNKFSDCAIAGSADFLVSNDRHFDVLKDIDFPRISPLNIDEFTDRLKNAK
jgi:putative PIN family toxin of toxin-antitoxin system